MENLAYENKKYTYADLENMPEDERYEIIEGDLFAMESPHGRHQLVLGELYRQISNYLQGKKCKVFIAPFDVVLSKSKKKNEMYNVLQPDLFVLCDMNKYEDSKVFGAPDFVIEILSPSTNVHDKYRKMNLYAQYGVKEYWIVDIVANIIHPYILNEKGVYELSPRAYAIDEKIKVNTLKGLTISLKDFLEENYDLIKEDEEEYKIEE